MKKVLLSAPEKFTTPDSCCTEKFYGMTKNVSVGVVTRLEYSERSFIVKCFNRNFANGNFCYACGNFSWESLSALLSDAIKGGWEVREFETAKEFAEWLASVC